MMHTSNHGRGIALAPVIDSETYDTERLKNIPYVEEITVATLNKHSWNVIRFQI